MDELEQQLNPDCFFRANRQYIINIEYVLFLSNYFGGKLIVRLKGYPNTKITVSKEKAQRTKKSGLTNSLCHAMITFLYSLSVRKN